VRGPNTLPANPRWWTAAILEKSINRNISVTVRPILTKFGIMTCTASLDAFGRQNYHCANNQDGGQPLTEVVYISVTVGRRRTGIVSCKSEQRGLFQDNYFRLCQSTSGTDLWGDDAAFCQITLTNYCSIQRL